MLSARALLLVAALLAGCGAGPLPKPVILPPAGQEQSASYTLSCPSIVGNLTTTLTYSVTPSIASVPTGDMISFSIEAPIAQVKAPVTPTFISGSTTFAIPAGFSATSASTNPESTSDFTSSSAVLDGGFVTLNLEGSFPIDGTPRAVPALVVVGTATGAAGSSITWNTPVAVGGEANAGTFLGNQSSSCTVVSPGPIGSTPIITAD